MSRILPCIKKHVRTLCQDPIKFNRFHLHACKIRPELEKMRPTRNYDFIKTTALFVLIPKGKNVLYRPNYQNFTNPNSQPVSITKKKKNLTTSVSRVNSVAKDMDESQEMNSCRT